MTGRSWAAHRPRRPASTRGSDRPPAQGRVRAPCLDPTGAGHHGLVVHPAAGGGRRGGVRCPHPRRGQRPRAGRPACEGPSDGRRAGQARPRRRERPTDTGSTRASEPRRTPRSSTRRASRSIDLNLVMSHEALLGDSGRRGSPRRVRPDPGRARPRDRGQRPRHWRGGLDPPALRLADDRRAGRDGQPRPPVPRRSRQVHPTARPGVPHTVVRCTHPTHRPRAPPRRTRSDVERQRRGALRSLQLRQGSTPLAGQTRAGRQRDHHSSDRALPHHPTATDRDDQAARRAGA